MNNEITDQKVCLVTSGDFRIWITDAEHEAILQTMMQKGIVQVGKTIIPYRDVRIFTAEQIDERDARRAGKGTWNCKCGNKNIPQNKTCGYCF